MSKLPEPPSIDTLKEIFPITRTLPKGTRIYRIFRAQSKHNVYWNTFRHYGPTSARFDHHLLGDNREPQIANRGILYGATGPDAVPTCLAEVFQATRTINRQDGAPVVCAFTLQKPLDLLDLTGSFATQIGASMLINSGPRPRARRWAQNLYAAYPSAHGILYPSSMYANKPAVALFERSQPALPRYPDVHRQMNDPALESVILKTAHAIRYRVVDL